MLSCFFFIPSNICGDFLSSFGRHRQDIILQSEFSLKAFFDMDSDGDNEVTKEEFLLYKILHMNLVDAEIVARIERQFNVRLLFECIFLRNSVLISANLDIV